MEMRVAELVAAGWPNSDIAIQLTMSRGTVQTHVSRILSKLAVGSRLSVTHELLSKHR
jgi:DNA-binding NarL/FixJ family response regulator